MPDEPDAPKKAISFEERQRQKAHDMFMARMRPAHDAMSKLVAIRSERMKFMADNFGLDDYDEHVMSSLLFASDEFEEPPFKLMTDLGWLYRGWMLAMDEAIRQMAHDSHPANPYYAPWVKDAALVIANAYADMDNLAEHDYATVQSLYCVPDRVHDELTEIVNGLSTFSEWRERGRSHRYGCLVTAIVYACGLPIKVPPDVA